MPGQQREEWGEGETMNSENVNHIRGGWVVCPVCGKKKVQRIAADTVAKNLPVYCARCRCESIVDILAGGKVRPAYAGDTMGGGKAGGMDDLQK